MNRTTKLLISDQKTKTLCIDIKVSKEYLNNEPYVSVPFYIIVHLKTNYLQNKTVANLLEL